MRNYWVMIFIYHDVFMCSIYDAEFTGRENDQQCQRYTSLRMSLPFSMENTVHQKIVSVE